MLRFLGSAKFTNGSLNYLVNHLSENIHSAKCKHYKKCKDCKKCKECKEDAANWCKKCKDCKKLSDYCKNMV